jgi:hypothetical protein
LNFADGERMYLDNNLVWLVSIGGDKEKFEWWGKEEDWVYS